MNEVEHELAPCKLGTGRLFTVEISPGFTGEEQLIGLGDTRTLDQISDSFASQMDEIRSLVFNGITIPGGSNSTGKPVHVGAAKIFIPADAVVVIRYDDKFEGIPSQDDGEDTDGGNRPAPQNGPR